MASLQLCAARRCGTDQQSFSARYSGLNPPPLIAIAPPVDAAPPLQVLVLDGNRIAALPAWMGELSRLETLSLGANQLAVLPPSLGRLQRLRQLLVPHNRLRALPSELGDCAALEELDVQRNVIEASRLLRWCWAGAGRLRTGLAVPQASAPR